MNTLIKDYEELQTAAAIASAELNGQLKAFDNIIASYLFHYFDNKDVRKVNECLELVKESRTLTRYRPILMQLVPHDLNKKANAFLGKVDNSKYNDLVLVDEESKNDKWFLIFNDYINQVDSMPKPKASIIDIPTFDKVLDNFTNNLVKTFDKLSELAETKEQKAQLKQLVESFSLKSDKAA